MTGNIVLTQQEVDDLNFLAELENACITKDYQKLADLGLPVMEVEQIG